METTMLKLMIECSRTGRVIHTGVETDPRTFAALPAFEAQTHCPHCNQSHRWTKNDVCAAPAGFNPASLH
jgi:hypothetical protein